ncbi:galactan export ABC transporter permease subunit Wzm/RfbD [Lentzea flaviverrucosa]|uniref:ABC-2 type transport system permease protein n=1 Tax=Lentzea flaviverrucosa TaxID=200379 RepID=A0A1H9XV92_9PSEU|nr:ABC transporter permease [Lentzea flaviverrucosa]RDI18681.1 ABC-2 type transport system permease protein [Lentzea flaviverrucosa]SES50098.1 ABC-2 type transport system permease protein [Lentzea flaviverrucosa]
MQATSTLDQAEAPPPVKSRSFKRAFADVREAWDHRELWGHLGWQDIKQRYRRSVIGPLWITISMGTTALALGLLYSVLFDTNVPTFLPYVTAGFIIWNFILGCITEGTDVFIANEGLIKHLPAPITVHVMRMVWRQVLFLAHNLVVYVVVLAIFFTALDHPYTITKGGIEHPGLSWTILLAVPGFALLAVNAVWVALLFGVISTRFRDIPPVVTSFINLVFFMTPIVWDAGVLQRVTGGGDNNWRILIAELNPVYHFVEVVRAPLLGHAVDWHHWAIVGGFTVIGWFAALVILRNYRARVSYWV